MYTKKSKRLILSCSKKNEIGFENGQENTHQFVHKSIHLIVPILNVSYMH